MNIELDISPRVAEVDVEAPAVDLGTLDPTHPVGIVIAQGQPGQRGPTGPSGEGAQIFGETPGGAQDGSNLVFTTADPFRPNSTAVYLNGLREFRGEGYTESAPNTIVFDDPPSSLDRLTIDYIVP